jgi:hypothetical protein
VEGCACASYDHNLLDFCSDINRDQHFLPEIYDTVSSSNKSEPLISDRAVDITLLKKSVRNNLCR